MKRFLLYALLAIASAFGANAADGDLFPYPQPPQDMDRLDERCDYIISQFWRQCDLKSAMSKHDKLRSTFSDWIALMPYAHADTVHAAIDRLLASAAKNGPQTLTLATMARDFVYSDSSDIRSAEIFLPFAKAVAANKKISSSDKAPFVALARKIENAQLGKPVGHFNFVSADGVKGNLDNYRTQMVAVIFTDPADSDGSLARVRLSADHNISTLVDRNLLTMISVFPGPADQNWLQAAASNPANWVSAAMPDANDWFELIPGTSIMLLDGRHKIIAKNLSVDDFMAMMAAFRQQSGM